MSWASVICYPSLHPFVCFTVELCAHQGSPTGTLNVSHVLLEQYKRETEWQIHIQKIIVIQMTVLYIYIYLYINNIYIQWVCCLFRSTMASCHNYRWCFLTVVFTVFIPNPLASTVIKQLLFSSYFLPTLMNSRHLFYEPHNLLLIMFNLTSQAFLLSEPLE